MVDINKLIDVNFNIVRETTPIGSYKKAVYFMNKTANTDFNGYCTYLLNSDGLTRQKTEGKDNAPLTVDTFNKINSKLVGVLKETKVIANLSRFFNYDGQELIVVLCDNKIPTATAHTPKRISETSGLFHYGFHHIHLCHNTRYNTCHDKPELRHHGERPARGIRMALGSGAFLAAAPP